MAKRIPPAVLIGLLVAILIVPQSASAASGFSYAVLRDACNSSEAAVLKVEFRAAGTTTANKLTIDGHGTFSSLFGSGNGNPWPQKETVFAADGTSHKLTLKRQYGGRVPESVERIVFRLRAWHDSTLLYDKTVKSRWC